MVSGCVLNRFEKTINRFLEIMDGMDKMYVNILEEAVIGEAEIMEKNSLEPVDMVKLFGYKILKEIALEELGYRELVKDSDVLEPISRDYEKIGEELIEASG